MDIFNEWGKIKQSKFSTQIKKEEVMNAIYNESNSIVKELKKRLAYKMNWSLFFALICTTGMIWTYDNPQALLISGIANFVFVSSYVVLRIYHRKMDKNLSHDDNLLKSLKSNETLIKSALNYETTSVLISLPVILIGAILFKDVYAGQSILEAIAEIKNLIVMVIVLAIGFPFVYIFGAKMNKIGFGPYLENLRKNINQLEILN